MENKEKPQRHSAFFDLERDSKRDALTRPASMLRSTEWGGLTLLSLLAGLAFPPYFFSVMALAFLNAGGLLWVTHLNEAGRKRLREFEVEFAVGHAMEEQGDIKGAIQHYEQMVPRYADQPKIAQIAIHRVEYLGQNSGEKVATQAVEAVPAEEGGPEKNKVIKVAKKAVGAWRSKKVKPT